MKRILISLFIAIAAAQSGCITSPMGTKPQPVVGEPDTYKFKLFINSFVGGETADEQIVPYLQDFRKASGYSKYKILQRQFNSVPTSYEYFVRFER